MRRRPFALLVASCGLALGGLTACVPAGPLGGPLASGDQPKSLSGSLGAPGAPGHRVAILLPLTGQNAGLAQDMLKAAQLALGDAGPTLDPQDTKGTPEGAAAAARAAVEAHDEIILGPLTNAETSAVAGAANGIPVLAFTSDSAEARPGVWTLGITPDQQAQRVIRAAQAEGKTRFAAVLPDNAFGTALSDALTRATADLGQPPAIRRYTGGFAKANAALRDVADYENRRGSIDARIKAARAQGDADGRAAAATIAQEPVAPAPFDALLITDTGLGPLLGGYDIAPPAVRVLGPALWARDTAKLGHLNGAWYAAPDPAVRAPFVQAFSAKYGNGPSPLADLAFDAASIARVVAAQGGPLTRAEGFSGVDGVFGLLPDGHVRRNLALFEVAPGGPRVVDPAAAVLPPPGS